MRIEFPTDFFWGTSTSAPQTETAFDHQWKGFIARDEFVLNRTTDHELRREEDLQYIQQFGMVYRCGVDWSRLQRSAFAELDQQTVSEYRHFFQQLQKGGTKVLLVLHHFAHPNWFEQKGGWLQEDNIPAFVDFARQCIKHFGDFVFNWNTFNEPNAYAMCAYFLGLFPPQRRSYAKANRVLRNMALAHDIVYDLIKIAYPEAPVSISINLCYFKALNIWGRLPAWFADRWYNGRVIRLFLPKMDYWGLSYYAYVPMNPLPITELDQPGKLARLHIRHDNMWGYWPQGLGILLRRVYRQHKMPVIILENGICTDDPQQRIRSIQEYLQVIHEVMQKGVDVRGYIHWSTWDNFEWHLGPSYRFGLVHVNVFTKERSMTEAGLFYAAVARDNALNIET